MEQFPPFSVYINSAEVAFSNYDFNIKLAFKGPQVPDSGSIIGHVNMSPQHFKAFVRVLTDNLARYERIFGSLNLTPDPEELKRMQTAAEDEAAATNE